MNLYYFLILLFPLIFYYTKRKLEVKLIEYENGEYGLIKNNFIKFTTRYYCFEDKEFEELKNSNGRCQSRSLSDAVFILRKFENRYKIINSRDRKLINQVLVEPKKTTISELN